MTSFCAAYEGQVSALSLVRTSRPCRDDAVEAGVLRLRVRGDRFENSLPEQTTAAGYANQTTVTLCAMRWGEPGQERG